MMTNNNSYKIVNSATQTGNYKFYPPLPLATSITRRRLLNDITNNTSCSAIVIQGPAGHGKTTLMQQILHECCEAGTTTSWLTLDEADNDISRFNACISTLVINAVEQQSECNITTPDSLRGDGAIENILRLLDHIEGSVSFFLDEFQVLNEPVNIALLESIIERSPNNVTFYIGSRSVPNLTRGKLLISGHIKMITAEELCFTDTEVSEFLKLVGLDATEQETQIFREHTGGWPAVLQLLHLALKGGKINRDTLLLWVKGCEQELTHYLANNVMQNQPIDRKQFMLKTSFLHRLSAPLCEIITGQTHAQEMLNTLVSQGLFLHSVDVERKWFKYHSIFSSYLREQFTRTDPEEVKEIHHIASDWFRGAGFPEEAIRHATLAAEFNNAADILEQWIPELILSARLQTADKFCSFLPENISNSRVMICWGRTWVNFFTSQRSNGRDTLKYLENILSDNSDSEELRTSIQILKCMEALIDDDPKSLGYWVDRIPVDTGDMPKYRCFEMSALANVKAIHQLQIANFVGAREHALLAQSLSERGEAVFSGAYATSLMACAMIQDGHLAQAISKMKDGLCNTELKEQGSFAMASLSAIYGLALYEAGNYIEAESHLRDSIDMISKTLPLDWQIAAHISLSRASALTENENTDSTEILNNAEKLGLTKQDPRLVRAMRRERIRIALTIGNFKEAYLLSKIPDTINDSVLPKGWFHFSEGCDDDIVCHTRMDIYCGEQDKALDVLSEAIEHADATGWIRRKIKLLILTGLAHKKNNDVEYAKKIIYEAVKLAAPQGYVSQFIDEGPECISILSELGTDLDFEEHDLFCKFISKVIHNVNGNTEPDNFSQEKNKLIEPLTRREKDILQLVAGCGSNREIADQLFVSYNTVKFHMKNLYGKIGAKNRIELISQAQKMHLI